MIMKKSLLLLIPILVAGCLPPQKAPERIKEYTSIEEALPEKENVEFLNFYEQNITNLPERIGDFPRLRKLRVQGIKFEEFPNEIIALSKLEYLDMINCGIKELPQNFGDLVNIKKLYLSDNQLSALPESVSKLTGLKYINLDRNNFTEFPVSLSNHKTLRWLRLNDNQITNITSFAGMGSLKCLYLNNNKIQTLPNDISVLGNLTDLALAGNQLKSLPENIFKLKKLERLSLQDNQLTNITVSLEKLPLRWIRLDGNNISKDEINNLKLKLPDCTIIY
jgi:Leucine-rich repeat (LRR) protein